MGSSEGCMLLISGPSGCGKSSICERLREDPRVVFSVSATTRDPRSGEENGREYEFLSKKEFRQRIEAGAFIEHAEVYGNMYGTLRDPMRAAIERGLVYLVEIDVQGALQLKALDEPGVYVFVAPPDFETLRQRLTSRGTESPEALERRLRKAEDRRDGALGSDARAKADEQAHRLQEQVDEMDEQTERLIARDDDDFPLR